MKNRLRARQIHLVSSPFSRLAARPPHQRQNVSLYEAGGGFTMAPRQCHHVGLRGQQAQIVDSETHHAHDPPPTAIRRPDPPLVNEPKNTGDRRWLTHLGKKRSRMGGSWMPTTESGGDLRKSARKYAAPVPQVLVSAYPLRQCRNGPWVMGPLQAS